jgi:flagellar hook assembly protein FlgD
MAPPFVEFELEKQALVRLQIFDVSGRLVRRLIDEPLTEGPHIVQSDGRSDFGEEVGSGVYQYRLDVGRFSEARPMVKLR